MIIDSILHPITRYCSYQERCHSEVRQKLYALGARDMEIDDAIIYLIRESYLNEERFALAFSRGHFRQKQWGRRKIAHGLKQKNIGALLIKKALAEISAEEYQDTMLKLITHKFSSLPSSLASSQRQQRVYQYMLQKGYESTLIANVFSDLGL